MARYAIGDVQGCYDELCALLEIIDFDPARDQLWMAGDLVNRGPKSLETLRLIRALGPAAVSVLGNHDVYLLKIGYTAASMRKRHDTLQPVLEAPDSGELLDWLRRRPLMHVDGPFAMVHAGLMPTWTVAEAHALAAEVENLFASDEFFEFLPHLWGNLPDAWSERLRGVNRMRVILNAMTRMRFCSRAGRMEFDAKGSPELAPEGYYPWFGHPARCSADATIVFGHWSALGLRIAPGIIALDTGCVWGEALTACRLEDRKVYQVRAGTRASRRYRVPGGGGR